MSPDMTAVLGGDRTVIVSDRRRAGPTSRRDAARSGRLRRAQRPDRGPAPARRGARRLQPHSRAGSPRTRSSSSRPPRTCSPPRVSASARTELEGRFQRLSRIEAMGQLTGGIAHDFNNLLAVILNYTALRPPGGARRRRRRALAERDRDRRAACRRAHPPAARLLAPGSRHRRAGRRLRSGGLRRADARPRRSARESSCTPSSRRGCGRSRPGRARSSRSS